MLAIVINVYMDSPFKSPTIQVPCPSLKGWPSRESQWPWLGPWHCSNIISSGIPSSILHLFLPLPVSLEHEDPRCFSKLSRSSKFPPLPVFISFPTQTGPHNSELQLSHLPIIFSQNLSFCSVVADWTAHPGLISHLFFLLLKGKCQVLGRMEHSSTPWTDTGFSALEIL